LHSHMESCTDNITLNRDLTHLSLTMQLNPHKVGFVRHEMGKGWFWFFDGLQASQARLFSA